MGKQPDDSRKLIRFGKARRIGNFLGSRWLAWQVIPVSFVFFVLAGTWPQFASSARIGIFSILTVSIAFSLADMLRKQTPGDEKWVDRAVDILLEIFVALGIGSALVLFKIGKGNVSWEEEIGPTLVLAVMIFGMNLVAKSTGTLSQFAESVADLKSVTQDLRQSEPIIGTAREALAHAHYATVAADALQINRDWLEINSIPDEDLGASLRTTLNAVKAWIQRGRTLTSEGDAAAYVKQRAWWRVMQIYHQEEVFDVGRFEVATNVRNYAFIILGLMAEFIDQMHSRAPKGRLVLLQVTPFAPKDFYNYPNGPKGRRFYHEAEFFGTYRRVVSVISRDPRVLPLRVFLAAPKSDLDGADIHKLRHLGWSLDPFNKMILDCARYHFIPLPVTGTVTRSGVSSRESDDFSRTPSLQRLLCINFMHDHNPARRLPRTVSRFLWVPAYVNLKNVKGYHFGIATRSLNSGSSERVGDRVGDRARHNWYERVSRFENFDRDRSEEDLVLGTGLRLREIQSNNEQIWDFFFDRGNDCGFVMRLQEAWGQILHEFRAQLGDLDASLVTDLFGDHPEEEQAKKRLLESIGAKRGDPLLDHVDRYIQDLRRLKRLEEECLEAGSGSSYTDSILKLVAHCQATDASFQLLREGHHSSSFPVSSAGVELGLAENWLHRFLIHEESRRLRGELERSGPLPLMDLLSLDLCGLEPSGESREDHQQLLRRLRICVVGDPGVDEPSQSNTTDNIATDIHAMEASRISQEFLLVGYMPNDSDDPSHIDWHALIRTELSEPFHTCRISLRFNGQEVESHGEWFREIWRDSRTSTTEFLESVFSERDLAES